MKNTMKVIDRRMYLLGKYSNYLVRAFAEMNKTEFYSFIDALDFNPEDDELDPAGAKMPNRIGE